MLDSAYLDYLAKEYSKLKNDVYFAIIWPLAAAKSKCGEIDKIIFEHCKIIYKKDIPITLSGLHNLTVKINAEFDWNKNQENNYLGAKKYTLVMYLLECNDFDKIIEIKEIIRDMMNMGKHSIHITDNAKETVICTNFMFNENTINLLNGGKYSFSKKQKMKNSFKRKIRNIKVRIRKCIVWILKKTRTYNLILRIVESILK